MTEQELAAIKGRCEAATPGPWRFDATAEGCILGRDGYPMSVCDFGNREFRHEHEAGIPPSKQDLAFILAARTDIPALVAEVERLRAALVSCKQRDDFHFPWCQSGEFSLKGTPCTCGLRDMNARIDAALNR